ncbi:MAG: OmpA family protein [Steroidobacteraceae bacterium]
MSIDLLDSMNSVFGGPLLRQTATLLEESENNTRAALRVAPPALLAGLLQKTTAPGGAVELHHIVSGADVDGGLAGKLSGILGNRGSLESMLGVGGGLLNTIFGNRSGALAHSVSQVAGVKLASATAMLSMAAPVLFGMLKKQVSTGGLDAGALMNLLLGQRSSLEKAGLDHRISQALGFSSLSNLLGSLPGGARETASAATTHAAQKSTAFATASPEHTRKNRWIPWAAAAAVAVFAVWVFGNRANNPGAPTTASTSTATPTTGSETRAGTIEPNRIRVASLPANVYFDSGEASIDANDRKTIAEVAATVKQAGQSVEVTGYTDRTGSPQQNLELAKDRADAVREALVREGVAESDVAMSPPEFVTGTGATDEARRVEIKPAK